jgi:hypothetical protein
MLAALPAAAQQSETYRPATAGEIYAGIMEGALASWVQDPAQRTTLSTAMATSYIIGVADSARNRQWCPKQPPSIQALSGVVLDYLADISEARRSENAAAVIAEALGRAYPCP